MIIIAIRSSCVGTNKICEGKFLIEYQLGYPSAPKKSTSKGSLLHKLMENQALKKLCLQRGETTFEDDIAGVVNINECELDILYDKYVNYYVEESGQEWTQRDHNEVKKWYRDIMNFNNGLYNPLNNTIVDVEKYFEIEIKEDWGKYRYDMPSGDVIEGNLIIRGTIDLIVEISGDIYVRDYKTGAFRDWSKGVDKTYQDLSNDFQFQLYLWVINQLYPNRNIFMEVIYSKYGPFSIYFEKSDIERTETKIRKEFEQIRSNNRPKWAKYDRDHVCRFCDWRTKIFPGTNQTYCNFFESKSKSMSPEEIMERWGNIESLFTYSGGGRHDINVSKNKE